MDVVYISKEATQNEELIYSLRSLKNVEHDKVFIAGGKPRKVKNVQHVTRYQKLLPKDRNIELNLKLAAEREDLSEEFIYMNDDFFFMNPVGSIPNLHRGTISSFYDYYKSFKSVAYMEGLDATLELLAKYGIDDPYNYELHYPLRMEKKKVLEMHEIRERELPDPYLLFHMRTFYGNYFKIGGRQARDCKVGFEERNHEWALGQGDYISTTEETFKGFIGDHIKSLFPDKSPYE